MKTWKHASLGTSLLAALLLGGGGCDFGDPANHASGGGTSIDGLTGDLVVKGGSPAAGAMVRVYSAGSSAALAKPAEASEALALDSVQTTSTGTFQFKNLPNGTYNLSASLRLADDTVLALYLPGLVVDGNTNIGVDTLQITGSLVLHVHGSGNVAIPGALCAIAGGIWQASSDSLGTCTLTEVPPGTFQATITHPSYLTALGADVTVIGGDSTSGGVVILISTANPLPTTPTLLSPIQFASGTDTSLTLSWNAASGATDYRVQVSPSPSFAHFALDDSDVTATSRMVTGLFAGVDYYWRVRARNAEGASPYSETFRFTTASPPGAPPAPNLTSPAANATGVSVTGPLAWSGSGENPAGYRVQVATDSGFFQIARDTSVANPGVNFTNSPLANNTVYYWRANATVAVGLSTPVAGTSAWSDFRKFTTVEGAPAAPTPTYPLSGAMDVPATPTFTWNAVSGATAYHLEVVGSDFISVPLVNDSTLTGTSRAAGPLQYLVTYGWRVKARNAAGWGPWSPTITIFRDEMPGPTLTAPQLVSPGTGAIGVALGSALTWGAVTGATSYRVQISTSPTFSTFALNDTNATTSRSAAPLDFSTTYHWRVHARNASGTSDWSEVRSFTTAPFVDIVLLPAPILSAPPELAVDVVLTPTLTWGAVTGVMTYHVQLSTSATFTTMLVDDSTLTTTSRAVGPLTASTLYFWRVRALSPSGNSVYSSTRTFTTATAPSPATWTTQTSGTTTGLNSVVWTGSLYVAVGDNGTVRTSSDGIAWVAQSSGTTTNLYSVVWTGTQLVAVGAAGTIRTSLDGITWTNRTSGTASALHSVAWTGTQLVAVGANGNVLTSPDGITWTNMTSGPTNALYGVAWTGIQLVAVGANGSIVTSPDGVIWTPRSSGTTNALNGVTWSGSALVAVGANGSVRTSTDGATWTHRVSGTTNGLYAVAQTSGGSLLTVGNSGIVLSSSDGSTWSAQVSGTANALYGMALTGPRLVAVGENGIILTSP